jgi:two-component system, chemotaxis family, protein-glutamate methylesterase/glutaminase
MSPNPIRSCAYFRGNKGQSNKARAFFKNIQSGVFFIRIEQALRPGGCQSNPGIWRNRQESATMRRARRSQRASAPTENALRTQGAKLLPGIDLFVIGGSAGGLSALLTLVRGLPAGLDAALCVAIHTSPDSPGLLPDIVARATALPCEYALNDETLKPGRIYCAPVDRHLLVEGDRMRVTRGPRENGFRPAVDPLFRTAARSFGARAAGIVLSGSLDDGSYGLALVKQAGGIAIVQDPQEALIPSMPHNAIDGAEVDYVITAAEMAAVIVQLAGRGSQGEAEMSADASPGDDPAERGTDLATQTPPGELTPLTCPECGGSLWEREEGRQIHFRCHVGHAFNGESLLEYHSQQVESALWTALRVLEEHAALQERMADRSEARELGAVALHFHRRAADSRQQAAVLRSALLAAPSSNESEPRRETG